MNRFRNIRFKLLILALCSLILLTIQGLSVQPALAGQAAAPRQAAFYNSMNPNCRLATVSWSSPQKAFVFAIASNGTVWGRTLNGSTLTWDNWFQAAHPVAGRSFACIGAASWAPGRIDIFGVDDENYVWHKYLDGTVWGPAGTWEALGNPTASSFDFPTGVQVVSWGSDRLDAFVAYKKYVDGGGGSGGYRDLSYRISWDSYNGGWSGWVDTMNGNVSTWGVNRLDIIGTWFNSYHMHSEVDHKYFNGTAWLPSNGEDLAGGPIWKFPFSLSRINAGKKLLDILARDTNTNAIRHKMWTGSNWSGWLDLGGGTSGATEYMPITGVSPKSSRIDIFEVRGGSAPGVYHKMCSNSVWNLWEYLGGELALNYVSATSWGPTRIDLFAIRSGDGSLWHLAWNGSTWTPSINGWEYIN